MRAPKPRLSVVPDLPAAESEDTGVWRPTNLEDYVGQARAQLKIRMWVTSALRRGHQPGHALLYGAPGLGKTTLAAVIAGMLNEGRPEGERVALHVTTGHAVSSPQQMAKHLAKLREGDVLFVDECHQMGLKAEEMLGLAMEDGRITIPGTRSGSVDAVATKLPKFTLVGATTKPANLSQPLRDRFGCHIALEFYSEEELAEIVARKAAREGMRLTEEGAAMLARVGRQTPRKTLAALDMVGAYADTVRVDVVDAEVVGGALEVMGVDELGLEDRDRAYLAVVASWAGRRVGLKPLAAAAAMDAKEITDDVEPYLLRAGFLDLNSRGRCLSRKAYEHLWPEQPIPPMLGLG